MLRLNRRDRREKSLAVFKAHICFACTCRSGTRVPSPLLAVDGGTGSTEHEDQNRSALATLLVWTLWRQRAPAGFLGFPAAFVRIAELETFVDPFEHSRPQRGDSEVVEVLSESKVGLFDDAVRQSLRILIPTDVCGEQISIEIKGFEKVGKVSLGGGSTNEDGLVVHTFPAVAIVGCDIRNRAHCVQELYRLHEVPIVSNAQDLVVFLSVVELEVEHPVVALLHGLELTDVHLHPLITGDIFLPVYAFSIPSRNLGTFSLGEVDKPHLVDQRRYCSNHLLCAFKCNGGVVMG
mmetsp:Transcript_26455/g.49445  ORF Transcript_26455/g.49445 Transcript_26455/m.49445 type:complete len:293 (-) Transcript_26455:326-1204(-)